MSTEEERQSENQSSSKGGRVRKQSRGSLEAENASALGAGTAPPSESVSNRDANVSESAAMSASLLGETLFGQGGLLTGDDESPVTPTSDEGLAPAWFASYAPTAGDLRGLQDPSANAPHAELIIGGHDDRQQVADTKQYPFRCICSLIMTAANGTRWIGTGWLVGPRLIATAGHNVFMHNQGGWARNIEVVPGRNGSSRPYGTLMSHTYQSTRGWTIQKRPEFDYAGIILNEAIGNKLGYFGYKTLDDEQLRKSIANVVGYPSDKLAGTLWGQSSGLARITTNTLIYSIDTMSGQSGCPVFRADNDEFYGIGIHNYGDRSGNSATRINADVYDNLERWQK